MITTAITNIASCEYTINALNSANSNKAYELPFEHNFNSSSEWDLYSNAPLVKVDIQNTGTDSWKLTQGAVLNIGSGIEFYGNLDYSHATIILTDPEAYLLIKKELNHTPENIKTNLDGYKVEFLSLGKYQTLIYLTCDISNSQINQIVIKNSSSYNLELQFMGNKNAGASRHETVSMTQYIAPNYEYVLATVEKLICKLKDLPNTSLSDFITITQTDNHEFICNSGKKDYAPLTRIYKKNDYHEVSKVLDLIDGSIRNINLKCNTIGVLSLFKSSGTLIFKHLRLNI